MQPKSQFNSGNLAYKALAPRSPATQFKELDCSTQAMQPRNQFSSDIQPTKPQQHSFKELKCSTQALNSGHADEKSIRFMQNSAKSTSRGESNEIKNGYSLKKRLHMSWVPSPTKKKKKKNKKQPKICAEDQTSEEGAEGEEGEWASTGVSSSPE